jgi:hypothetical protein
MASGAEDPARIRAAASAAVSLPRCPVGTCTSGEVGTRGVTDDAFRVARFGFDDDRRLVDGLRPALGGKLVIGGSQEEPDRVIRRITIDDRIAEPPRS